MPFFKEDQDDPNSIYNKFLKGAEGALSNGTRVMKINSEKGDVTEDLILGTVLGSVNVEDLKTPPDAMQKVNYLYMVKYDNLSDNEAGIVVDYKLLEVE